MATVTGSRQSASGRAAMACMLVVGALVSRVALPAETVWLAYALLAVYAMRGRAEALLALALCCLFNLFNPGLAAPLAGWERYVVLAAAVASVAWRGWRPGMPRGGVTALDTVVFATLLLGGFLVIHAVAFSRYADISLLKAVLWTATMAASASAWAHLSPDRRDALARRLRWGLIATMLASGALLGSPDGYLRNDVGFQGITSHPQSFGVVMALLCAWSWGLFGACDRGVLPSAVTVAGSLVMVVLSAARTGAAALVLAIAVAPLAAAALAPGGLRAAWPAGPWRWRFVAAAVLLTAAAVTYQDDLNAFLNKRGWQGTATIDPVEQFREARGPMLRDMWANIRHDPWRGVGFGVASRPELVAVERAFGVPVAASVEKGTMPLAILEETGTAGLLAVSWWCWIVVRRAARAGAAQLTVTLTVLIVNLGESMLFSPGGVGLLCMVLLGWASTPAGATRPPAPTRP